MNVFLEGLSSTSRQWSSLNIEYLIKHCLSVYETCLLFHCRTRGKLDVEIRIRAQSPDGLLFWVSEDETSPYSDYLAIGLRAGYAQFGYNLGSGEVVLTSNGTRLDDNRWHTIRIQRYQLRPFIWYVCTRNSGPYGPP